MPVWNSNAKALMFESIDLSTMLQLVATVVKDQLMPFFSGLLANNQPGS